jgi:hypothetical protein
MGDVRLLLLSRPSVSPPRYGQGDHLWTMFRCDLSRDGHIPLAEMASDNRHWAAQTNPGDAGTRRLLHHGMTWPNPGPWLSSSMELILPAMLPYDTCKGLMTSSRSPPP